MASSLLSGLNTYLVDCCLAAAAAGLLPDDLARGTVLRRLIGALTLVGGAPEGRLTTGTGGRASKLLPDAPETLRREVAFEVTMVLAGRLRA